jgi:pimeloyl-ACP methyl ester carboxylesterase
MTTRPTPIVMLHGVGLDHTMWTAVRARLGAAPTLAPDMLGHGAAPHPEGPYELAMFVQHVAGTLDAAGHDVVDLIGFSMGALVAQGFALAYRDRVRRLVLVSSVFDRTVEEREAIVARVADVRTGGYLATIEPALDRWFSPTFATAHPEVVGAVRNRLLANDVVTYGHAYEVFALADGELVDRVHEIAVPTLVITGGDDQRSTPAMTLRLAAALPQGRAVIVPDVRHALPLEAPDQLADHLRSFLKLPDGLNLPVGAAS